ncbi:hypothetical protein EVAR_64002_1 [Eumeta japonica]|uniref:Uncharacterized protein n=1 Tax=Eumeta variegata TaxID=151549 RepID=A0A4C1Z478_EUMVA|nr:hypothetical protein EVAR_64002_1 [Eumeta japonica]
MSQEARLLVRGAIHRGRRESNERLISWAVTHAAAAPAPPPLIHCFHIKRNIVLGASHLIYTRVFIQGSHSDLNVGERGSERCFRILLER